MNPYDEYELLEATTPLGLSVEVTKRLGAGWELWGTPFALPGKNPRTGDDYETWYQAVVKPVTPPGATL